MNKIQVFENKEFGQLRTLDIGGVRWFVGKDVAIALGYSNASKAIIAHVDNAALGFDWQRFYEDETDADTASEGR